MGARARALAADEIAVAGRSAALARRHLVGVHAEARRTARLAPFEACFGEDPIEPLFLGLRLYQTRARHNDRPAHVGGLAPALEDRGGGAQVFDAAVGARADEDVFDRHFGHRCTGGEAHVVEALLRSDALRFVGEVIRRGHAATDGDDVLGRGAPCDAGLDIGGIDRDALGEHRALIGVQCAPIGHRRVPLRALGRHRAALEIGEGRVIRRDQTSPRAGLDAHVADREALLHGHRLEHPAAIFDHVAAAARRADAPDDVEDQILGAHPGAEIAVHPHFHRP